jgi:hypothetical protein
MRTDIAPARPPDDYRPPALLVDAIVALDFQLDTLPPRAVRARLELRAATASTPSPLRAGRRTTLTLWPGALDGRALARRITVRALKAYDNSAPTRFRVETGG